MPELPEVEVVRHGLAPAVTGATIESIDVFDERSLRRHTGEFQELFAYSPEDAVDYTVHDDHVDCEPVVRDAVVLALPFQPVCRADCPGLDPETGEKMADIGERPPRDEIDPRWAALKGLLADDDTPH